VYIPAKWGGTNIDPRLLPGLEVEGFEKANEPLREDAEAESTESRRWARRPRVAPRTRWDLQDSQYRDWKFSTCTAWVLISDFSSCSVCV